jgi:hypothetical protein
MKRLSYVDRSIITEDRASDAVLEYAQLLALRGKSDVIAVPAVTHDGSPMTVDLLIGPASQLIAEPDDSQATLDVEAFLADVTARVDRLQTDSYVSFRFLDEAEEPG